MFYDYAKANPDGRPLLWSEWLKRGSRNRLTDNVRVETEANPSLMELHADPIR
jgi:hypothetical protein